MVGEEIKKKMAMVNNINCSGTSGITFQTPCMIYNMFKNDVFREPIWRKYESILLSPQLSVCDVTRRKALIIATERRQRNNSLTADGNRKLGIIAIFFFFFFFWNMTAVCFCCSTGTLRLHSHKYWRVFVLFCSVNNFSCLKQQLGEEIAWQQQLPPDRQWGGILVFLSLFKHSRWTVDVLQCSQIGSSVLPCAPRLPGEEIWIKTKELGVNNLQGTVNGTQTGSLSRCGIFFFLVPTLVKAEDDVCPGILCRLFQMHSSSLSEDFASCACRVAGPQPRGFSLRQQSDGQYHRPTRRDGLPQVSQRIPVFFLLLLLFILPLLLLLLFHCVPEVELCLQAV